MDFNTVIQYAHACQIGGLFCMFLAFVTIFERARR